MKSVSIKQIPARQVRNQGFSLIEILVSVVVLSVGLIGLGGLQIAAIKGTNESHFRTAASLLMMDMADRMRANIDGVGAGEYRKVSTSSLNCNTAPSKQCDTQNCTATELAKFDMHSIVCGKSGIKALLPSGKLIVSCVDSDCSATLEDAARGYYLNKTHNITIEWQEAKNKKESQADGKVYNLQSISVDIVP